MKPLAVGLIAASILGAAGILSWTALQCVEQMDVEGRRVARHRAYEKFEVVVARNQLSAAMSEAFGANNYTIDKRTVPFNHNEATGGFTCFGNVSVRFKEGVKNCSYHAQFALNGEVTSFTYSLLPD